MIRQKKQAVSSVITGLVFALASGGTTGCRPGAVTRSPEPVDGQDLPILSQVSGTYSRLTSPARIVVRDRATLAQLPLCDLDIDFDSQMALVAGLGPTPTNELGIRIKRVWRDGARLRVMERRIHPGPDHRPGLRPASPWTVAVIPRSDLNVEGYASRVPEGLLDERPRPE